jgi:uncharacterized membrane protein
MTLVAGVGTQELILIALVLGAVVLVPLAIIYWVVRLAVRHGSRDRDQRTNSLRG